MGDGAPDAGIMEVAEPAPDIDLTMDRPLFEPPLRPQIDEVPLVAAEEIPCDALFDHTYVDKERLAANIRQALQIRSQVSLDELVHQHPLEQGLAELVADVNLSANA